MFALFLKEIRGFFSSITGYIVIIVYLVINGLFMWVFPGQFNILDAGYSNLDTLFLISPWVFLFLVPAVTMRLFAEEKRTGTIEQLLTRPLTDLQIVLAKYFAGIVLVLMAIIPTFIYYYSVYKLGSPVGNLDSGGIWGSYIGLFFLAAIYVAVGVFSSTLSENQIVAFIIGVIITFFLYAGFDSISSLKIAGGFDDLVIRLGISDHYRSMSRGVIDTRDIMYFVSVAAFFILLTRIRLEKRKWR